jgi:hypothetical protein
MVKRMCERDARQRHYCHQRADHRREQVTHDPLGRCRRWCGRGKLLV